MFIIKVMGGDEEKNRMGTEMEQEVMGTEYLLASRKRMNDEGL